MEVILSKILPILGYFSLGLIGQKLNLISQSKGNLLVKVSFFYTLPALVFHSLTHTQLTIDLIYLPAAGIAAIALVTVAVWLYTRNKSLSQKQRGTIILGSMSMNAAFAIPFVLLFFGHDAMIYAVLFDLGNAIMVFTACYFVAFHYGDHALPTRAVLGRIVRSPLLQIFTLAIICSLLEWRLPEPFDSALLSFGSLTGPLLLIGMGVLFTPKIEHLPSASVIIAFRMLGGLAVIMVLVQILGVTDTAIVAGMVMVAAAPMGMTSLSYGLISGLDTQVLASAISISILLGLFWLPVLAFFLGGS